MHREGHHGLNALLYAPIALITALYGSIELAIIGAVFFVGTSSIPDFDRHFDNNMKTSRSDLWTIIPIKHRGFTHTVWFAIIAGVVGSAFAYVIAGQMTPQHMPEVVGVFGGLMVAGGVIGHILGDMMTPMGVKPFSPIRKTKYAFAWFLAKSKWANYGFLFFGGTALLLALGYGFREVGIDLAGYSATIWLTVTPGTITYGQ